MIESSFGKYSIVAVLAAAIVAFIQFFTDDSGLLGILGILVVPGFLPAALFFPEGFHSGSPYSFMVLVVAFDGLIYGIPLFLIWRSIERRRSEKKLGDR